MSRVACLMAALLPVAGVASGEGGARGVRIPDEELIRDAASERLYVLESERQSAAGLEAVGLGPDSWVFDLGELGRPGDELLCNRDSGKIYVISRPDSSAAGSRAVEVFEVDLAENDLVYEPASGRLYGTPPRRAGVDGEAAPAAHLTTPGLEVRELALAANDLVYDPVSGLLYASVPSRVGVMGNSIVPIDPVSGTIGPAVFVGSEPGALAVSDDGQVLYVSLEGAFAVRRVDLPTLTPGLQFGLGSDPFFGPYLAEDMEVQPGNAAVLAVSRKNLGVSPRHAGVGIYDEGVLRPDTTQRHTGSNRIEFSADPALLYGYNNETTEFGFRKIAVDDQGATETSAHQNFISGFGVDIEFHDGRVYATTGRALDPVPPLVLGTYTGVGFGAGVRADSTAGLVDFLTLGEILVYHLATFVPLDTLIIAGISGTPGSLVHWGSRKWAFRTSGDQLFLVVDPGADLSITKDDGVSEVAPGDPVTYTIAVSNAGPRDALGATVTDPFPADLGGCTWTCVPAGGATCTSGPVAGDISDTIDLPVGASATYSADCVVGPGASAPIANTATVSSPLAVADPAPGDNSATDIDLVLGPCGHPNERLLEDVTIDSTLLLLACSTITTGPAFELLSGGDLTLRAGEAVALKDGSRVAASARLTAQNDPLLSLD